MTTDDLPENPESELPQEVVAAWKQKYGPPGDIPDSLERQILADARQHLESTKPKKANREVQPTGRTWMRWSAGVLAAVAVVALLPLMNSEPQPQLAQRSASPAARSGVEAAKTAASVDSTLGTMVGLKNDVDANGVVNILDAFALARQLDDNTAGTNWDQNQDGRTDVADVDLIAMNAVML